MTYRVALDVFEGPFDLLLQLIAKHKLDIHEVDLSEITADFLAHMEELEHVDLETATRFLLVAATLIEIKALRLLPQDEQDELEDALVEARDMLYARLLEYQAFRQAAGVLRERLDVGRDFLGRRVALEPHLKRAVPRAPLPIDVDGLARLAAVAFQPRPEPQLDLSHIKRAYLTVRAAAERVLARLTDEDARTTLRALTHGQGRSERVAFFLALLELYKLGHVGLDQPERFGDVDVVRHAGGRDLPSLEAVGGDIDDPTDDETTKEPVDHA